MKSWIIITFFLALLFVTPAFAYPSGFNRCKDITITDVTGNNHTNVPIVLTDLNTSSGALSTGEDIVVYNDGCWEDGTEITFGLEKRSGSNIFNISFIENLSANQILNYSIYYKNTSIVSGYNTSWKDNRYNFWDDFETGNFSKWSYNGSKCVVQSDVVANGTYAVWCDNGASANREFYKNVSGWGGNDNVRIQMSFNFTDESDVGTAIDVLLNNTTDGSQSDGNILKASGGSPDYWKYYNGGFVKYPNNVIAVPNTWNFINFYLNFSNSIMSGGVNYTGLGNANFVDENNHAVNTDHEIIQLKAKSSISYKQIWVDDYYAWKVIPLEPTVVLGAEEGVDTTWTIAECTGSHTIEVLNITFYDEETKNETVADLNINFVTWNLSKLINDTYNLSLSGNSSYRLCSSDATSKFDIDMTAEYSNSTYDYDTRYYFLQNYSISNSVAYLDMYMQNGTDTTDITFSIYDEVFVPKTDVVLQARRYYVEEDSYNIVGMGRTSGTGTTQIPLKRTSGIYYDFIVIENGTTIGTFDPQILDSTALTLYINSYSAPDFFNYWGQVDVNCYISNTTNNAVCTLIDSSGTTHNATMKIYKIVNNSANEIGRVLICSDNEVGSSSTFTCALGESPDGNSYQQLLLTSDYLFWNKLETFIAKSLWGTMGILASVMIMLTTLGIGINRPSLSMIFMALGIIVSFSLGLLSVSGSAIISIVCLLLVLAIKVNK